MAAILTFFAVRLGRRPADPEHPYGHSRAENLGALGEAALLLAGGLVVSGVAIAHLIEGGAPPDTHWYVFAVIGVAFDRGRQSHGGLGAHGADAMAARRCAPTRFISAATWRVRWRCSSGCCWCGPAFGQADSVAALIVAAVVLIAAARLIEENANVLMDRTPAEAMEAAERAIAGLAPDVELLRLRVRESAGRYFADVVAAVAPGEAVIEGHRAANLVEEAVERALPGCDVVVHVEPRRDGLELRDHVLSIALAEPLVRETHDVRIFEEDGSLSVSLHLKFPAELDLRTANAIAARVEQAIRAQPGVDRRADPPGAARADAGRTASRRARRCGGNRADRADRA